MSTNTDNDYAGREPTYHAVETAQYVLPNDAPEHVRLETQASHIAAMMGNQIVHAPIKTSAVQHILDVGCGTGIVTEHLASKFPDARIYGLDLSPVPQLRNRPANIQFLQGNILEQTPDQWQPKKTLNSEGGFDLIFSRLLVCGMSKWPDFVKTELSLLNRNGWAEIHDVDWVWYDGEDRMISDAWPWWQTVRAAGEERGLDFQCASRAKKWMEEAGFVDVQVKIYRWPFGEQWEDKPEMRGLGDYVAKAMPELVWHMIPKMMEGKGCSDKDIARMREDMKRDFEPEKGKHWKFYVTCGRKGDSS